MLSMWRFHASRNLVANVNNPLIFIRSFENKETLRLPWNVLRVCLRNQTDILNLELSLLKIEKDNMALSVPTRSLLQMLKVNYNLKNGYNMICQNIITTLATKDFIFWEDGNISFNGNRTRRMVAGENQTLALTVRYQHATTIKVFLSSLGETNGKHHLVLAEGGFTNEGKTLIRNTNVLVLKVWKKITNFSKKRKRKKTIAKNKNPCKEKFET